MKISNNQQHCPVCNGTGIVNGQECHYCSGTFKRTSDGDFIEVTGSDSNQVRDVLAGVMEKHNKLTSQSADSDKSTKGIQSEESIIRLKQLEHEYDLSRRGLLTGARAVIGAFISGFASLLVAAFAFLVTGKEFLSGNHLVSIFLILAVAVLVYFSFVFSRAIKLKGEITKEKKKFELTSEKKAK